MKRTVFLWAFLFVVALGSQPANVSASLFDDDFTTFDITSVWETATMPGITGPTNEYNTTTVDGRSVVHLKSTYTIPAGGGGDEKTAKGFQTRTTFAGLSLAVAELSFKTGPSPDNIDGLIALSLWNPTAGKYIRIYLHGGFWGEDRVVRVDETIENSSFESSGWSYDTWYRFVITAQSDEAKVAFLTDGGSEICSHTFDVGLNDLGNFKLALTQYIDVPGEGEYINVTYADRLTLVPLPPSVLLLGSGLAGLLALGGRRRRRRS